MQKMKITFKHGGKWNVDFFEIIFSDQYLFSIIYKRINNNHNKQNYLFYNSSGSFWTCFNQNFFEQAKFWFKLNSLYIMP